MNYDDEGIEYRHLFGGEVRAVEQRERDFVIKGIAAVFNEWADLGLFRERIQPGAFKNALPTSDVRFLVNHGGLPLARTTSGTLDLSETREGLAFEARLDRSDPDVLALIPKIERGDLSQLSFAFDLAKDGQEWKGDDRTLTEFRELYDVSLVTFPAYETTKITALRSRELYDARVAIDDVRTSALREQVFRRYF